MVMTISPIRPGFVGRVSGVDLTQPLRPDEARVIEAGMAQFAALVFHGQEISDVQQVAFSLNFGALEPTGGGSVLHCGERRLAHFIEDVSNLDEDNRPLALQDPRRLFGVGNQLWHSDSSFRTIPPKYSILSGRITVLVGGDTEIADMRAAYDGLDARTKALLEPLICEHSWMYSRAKLGLTAVSEAERAAFEPARQPLVRTHPVTGRKSLFLSSHIGAIVGWPLAEGRIFIRDLTERALSAGPIYCHAWRRHDLLMWDNRATMHRVTPFDDAQARDMRRTTVAGDGPVAGTARD